MKVKELMERLKKCDPEAEVFYAIIEKSPLEGDPIVGLLEILYHDDNEVNTVVIRG